MNIPSYLSNFDSSLDYILSNYTKEIPPFDIYGSSSISSYFSGYLHSTCDSIDYRILFDEVSFECLTVSNAVEKMLDIVENKIEQYIYDNFDRYNIQEAGEYIYSVITEKAYEITEDIITHQKDYELPLDQTALDNIINTVFMAIDLNNLYEIIDDILNQPVTMEEKLANIGMSQRDFL